MIDEYRFLLSLCCRCLVGEVLCDCATYPASTNVWFCCCDCLLRIQHQRMYPASTNVWFCCCDCLLRIQHQRMCGFAAVTVYWNNNHTTPIRIITIMMYSSILHAINSSLFNRFFWKADLLMELGERSILMASLCSHMKTTKILMTVMLLCKLTSQKAFVL